MIPINYKPIETVLEEMETALAELKKTEPKRYRDEKNCLYFQIGWLRQSYESLCGTINIYNNLLKSEK